MIVEVNIENLAVIEALHIDLQSGFSVLTGETGAGKSLLIQSLSLIGGARASADVVRQGQPEALIEARVVLHQEPAKLRLASEGYGDGPEYVLRRIIKQDGQHRIYLNGKMATAALLQDTIAPELQVHAQHSQQRLLEPATQLELLDTYARCLDLRGDVEQAYKAWM